MLMVFFSLPRSCVSIGLKDAQIGKTCFFLKIRTSFCLLYFSKLQRKHTLTTRSCQWRKPRPRRPQEVVGGSWTFMFLMTHHVNKFIHVTLFVFLISWKCGDCKIVFFFLNKLNINRVLRTFVISMQHVWLINNPFFLKNDILDLISLPSPYPTICS